MAQILSPANDVNILKEIRMLRISEANPCRFLFLCLWQTFLLFKKYTAYCLLAQVYQQICCIVYFWHVCYHAVAFLFIERLSFASPRKYQGATEMVKRHI